MSSLSNQLAALSSKNAGFAHSSQTSAIGLGFTHSTKHGHSITIDNVKRKPSILYDNARKAADVPEVALRENAVEALTSLREIVGSSSSSSSSWHDVEIDTLFDIHSLKFERGTSTPDQNKQIDETIDKLLQWLTTCIAECPSVKEAEENPSLLASLQIIEYLLRKYEIHTRDSHILSVFLPIISSYPELLQRALGLINLQSVNGGMWSFLRPYAAAESPSVNRVVLAKAAAHDEAVFGWIARTASRTYEVWKTEMGTVRRGISAILSFSASILVEALHIQSRMGGSKSASVGGVRENFVRNIFPLIVSACGSKGYGEWKEWGRLLAVTLATLCPLSDVVQSALCDAVVAGIPFGSSKKLLEDVVEEDWNLEVMDEDEVDDATSAIMTLLSILGSSGTESDDKWKYFLPMLPSKKQNSTDYLGCDLPYSTYKVLSNRKALFPNVVAGAMGAVLDNLCDDESSDTEKIRSVGPLLGAIAMHVFEKMEKEAKKDLRKKGRELGSDGDLLFLLSLIKEGSLVALWEAKNASLVSALAVQTVISFDNLCGYFNSSDCNKQKQTMIVDRYKMILDSLTELDTAASEQGLTYAIDFVTSKSRQTSLVVSEHRMSNLALLFGNAESFATAKKHMSSEGENDSLAAATDGAAFLLPPRVALEHADATVRINAIAGLKVMDVSLMESDLGSALLRRLSIDDDPTVVVSAGEVLETLLQHHLDDGEAGDLFDDLNALAEAALASLFRWTLIGRDDAWSPSIFINAPQALKISKSKDSNLSPLLACLRVCGLVGQVLLKARDLDDEVINQSNHLFNVLFLSTAAHIHAIQNKGSFKEISQAAISALSKLCDSESTTVKHLFSQDNTCFSVIQYCFGNHHEMTKEKIVVPDIVNKRFLWLGLHTLSAAISSSPTLAQANQVITLVLSIMRSYNKESTKSTSFQTEVKQVVTIMNKCVTFIGSQGQDDLSEAMLKLISVNSSVAFQYVSKPVIGSYITSLGGNDHSGLVALINASMYSEAQSQAISRLLSVASELFGERKSLKGASELFLPLLSMLSHPDRKVRQDVMMVLEKFTSAKEEMIATVCNNITDKQSPIRSSMVMDGSNALPQLLGYVIRSSESPAQLQEYLLKGCSSIAVKDGSVFSSYGCRIAAVLLCSMEKSGESSFPLSTRWELAGKDLFNKFTAIKDGETAGSSQDELRNCIATMLKGVLITDVQSDSQIISIGPSNLGRVRSYSFGTSESFRLLEPYPQSMTDAVIQALAHSSSKLLTQSVIEFALSRQSWANGVFPKLDDEQKQRIVSALITLKTERGVESAGKVLLNLTLKASDFTHLLKKLDVGPSENQQLAMVLIADIIRGKLDALQGKASDISKLSSLLFGHLLSISSSNAMEVGDAGSREYTRTSIVQCLVALHSEYKNQLSELSKKQKSSGRKRSRSHSDVGKSSEFESQAKLLVGLVGGDISSIDPLHSARGKALSLSLLTCLCEESPSTVVNSLLPALSSLEGHAVGDALSAIVPAFCSHAVAAGLSFFDLLDVFVAKVAPDIVGNKILIGQFANALMVLPESDASESMASFITSVIAVEAFNLQTLPESNQNNVSPLPDDSRSSIFHVIANYPSVMKVSIALSLLQYAESLMSFICGSEVKENTSRIIGLAISDINDKTSSVPYRDSSKPQRRSVLYLTSTLLLSVQGIISTPSAKKLVRKSTGSEADLCLRLWQELMHTHVNSLSFYAKQDHDNLDLAEKKFWVAAPVVVNECLESLQNILPVSHFLASVESILNDDSVESYMKKKTIRLLTDRVAEVNHHSPEYGLFLEMVPELVSQLKTCHELTTHDDPSVSSRKFIVKQQNALIAIESFVTSLYPTTDNSRATNTASEVFLPALVAVSELLTNTTSLWSVRRSTDTTSEDEDAQCQLLSSCALCISSLVLSLKARCLHLLPQIVGPLIEGLKSVNRAGTKDQSVINFQLAVLRLISTIAEMLPGFLLPHLPLIFSADALPATSLQDSDDSVIAASKQLELSLATKTPARQLIPCVSNALVKTLANRQGWQEACVVLRVMNATIENSSRSDLTSVVGKIFNGLVTAYACEGDAEGTTKLLANANTCLLSLVMKLSETQLRPLYARLREWRGGIEGEGSLYSRRYAFWSLSAELSKALKSIFFPCLTSVIADVVDELEHAVSILCSKKRGGEAKRRRTEEAENNLVNGKQIKSLQPLLLCLESAFKADAHEGGDWTRGDDNQRYNVILNHLGKLLLAQVPSDVHIVSDLGSIEQKATSGYERLVGGVGTEEHGSVVGCLTALATAAGNEQLWKPLNFAVLVACGHKRSEVRKAGVRCLLSIIESIGEEYMVLLPECLPVLSELLEDGDEEIAGMARDCVRQGEELLGESLEENLR